MSGGMEYRFAISVTGTGEMDAAASAAEHLERALEGARNAEAELGAAGAEAAAGLTAQTAAMEAAKASMKDLDKGALSGLNRRLSEGVTLIGGMGDGLKTAREETTRSDQAMRDLEESSRRMGLTARGAGLDASRAMDDYRRKIEDLRQTGADAEQGINDLQRAVTGAEGGGRRRVAFAASFHGIKGAAKDLRELERGSGDAGRGIRDLENAASGAASAGGGLSKLTGLVSSLGMPAAIAGLAGLAAGAVPAVLSLGGGFAAFGALAYPALSRVKQGLSDVTYAQQQYQLAKGVEKRDPTTANLAAQNKTLAALKTTWAQIPKPIAGAVSGVRQFEHAWSQAGRKSGIQKAAFGDIKLLAKDAQDAIPAVTGLAKAFQPLLGGGLKDLGKEFKSSGFKSWIKGLEKDMGPAAHALKGIGSAMGGFITQLTAKEAKPGTQMLTSIGKFLKTITPGMVTGLTGLTKGVGELFDLMNQVASSKAMTEFVHGAKAVGRFLKGPAESGITKQVLAGLKAKEQQYTTGTALSHLKNINVSRLATFHYKVKGVIDGSDFGSSIEAARSSIDKAFKTGRAAVQVKIHADHGDIAKQVQDAAKTGGAIPLKGKVTLSGLGAGIKSQIASLKIPDTKVKVSISVTGTGSAKAAMASVVGAAKHASAAAGAALNSLGSAGAAAGRAMDAGLAGGILAGESSVVAAASQVAGAAGAAARAAAGISSPSKVWKGIGKNMIAGLVLALQGGKAQVEAAARAIADKAVPFKDTAITATIKKLRDDVRKAFKAGDITGHQRDGLVDYISSGNSKLMRLAQQRSKILGEIKAATALAKSVQQAAIQSADITTIASNALAAKNAGKPAGTIQQQQEEQLGKIKAFTGMIRKLKREGLDKTSIKQLLAAGVSGGSSAAQQLLGEGPKAVKESAKLQQEIIKASKQLGVTGANAAYESASQIGGGLASGLRAQLKPVVAAMRQIARALVATLAKELGLKPGQGLGGLLGDLGGGGGGGGAGHHRHHPHHAKHVGNIHEFPGGPSGHLHGGPPMRMHPGSGGGAIHVTVHSHLIVSGQEMAATQQTYALRHGRRNVAVGLKPGNRAA